MELTYKIIGKNIWLFVDGVKAANFGSNQGALTKVLEMEKDKQKALGKICQLAAKLKTFDRIAELACELHDECEKI